MKQFPTKKIVIMNASIVFILVFAILLNVLALGTFDRFFENYVGVISTSSGTSDLDTNYYSSLYATNDELLAADQALCEELAAEGIVLLKNDGGMPYPAGTTFSVFGVSSVNFVYQGTGSGEAGTLQRDDIKTVFEARGLKVNESLWNFYSSGAGASYKRGAGAIGYGVEEDYSINECPASVLSSANLQSSFNGTTAMYIISRTGGEGRDLPRSMIMNTDRDEDKAKSYLEPDSVELGVIEYLQNNDAFSEVILVVNSANALELGWTENYSKINTILYCPGTGTTGLYALPEILQGRVNPSGHLVDTFAYNAFSSPASYNCDEARFYPNGQEPVAGRDGSFGNSEEIYYYMYQEGIYVGYRYYETRYEDVVFGRGGAESTVGSIDGGSWDYAKEVKYPFGYGLSFTNFVWSDFETSWNNDTCTVSVTVTNTGNVAGKDVVEVYAQTPYTQYDIDNGVEKSSVQLVGFEKTKLLQPNESETLEIVFSEEQLKSYDEHNAKTYILDAGTYYITAATDAHAAINNIIMKKDASKAELLVPSPSESAAGNAELVDSYTPQNTNVDTEKYAKDTKTGTEITNRFDKNQRMDDPATTEDESITYLTRSDWENTFPTQPYGEVDMALETRYSNRINGEDGKAYVYKTYLSAAEYEKLKSTDSGNTEDHSDTKVVFGKENGVSFIELRGLDYNDPLWDELLDQLSARDMTNYLMTAYGYPKTSTVQKAFFTIHTGGPQGMKNNPVGFTSEVMVAQTWNKELATRFGVQVGEDVIHQTAGKDATPVSVGGPGVNTHRTPFCGRAYEYYSEDGFLSGAMASAYVSAAGKYGVINVAKHFALNDCDNNRGDHSDVGSRLGVATFANEQSIREIYLKPFEMAVKSDGATVKYWRYNDDTHEYEQAEGIRPGLNSIMSSFNRIGYTWAGGDFDLLTSVLRREWGFIGNVMTDMDHGNHMNSAQMLMAGGDAKLANYNTADYDGNALTLSENTDPNLYYHAREAAHRRLYAEVNSFATNGLVSGIQASTFPIHHIIVYTLDVVLAVVAVFLAVREIIIIRNWKKQKTTSDHEGRS